MRASAIKILISQKTQKFPNIIHST